MKTLPFKLPFDKREFEITGNENDTGIMKMIEGGKGHYEPQVMNVLAAFVDPKSVCIDIGANIGMISIALASLARKGKVYSFEAAMENYKFLKENADANGFSNIIPINRAVYDENTTIDFNYNPTEAGGSFISLTGETGDKTVSTYPVEAVRLDDWVEKEGLDRLDLVKLDVEGAEFRVLRGARATLEKFKPDLEMEFFPATLEVFHNDDPMEVYRMLRDLYPFIYAIREFDYNGSLVRIDSYVDLYSIIRRGKGIVDIVCTHKSEKEIAAKISITIPNREKACLYINRYHDGWSKAKYSEIIYLSDRKGSVKVGFHTNLPENMLPAEVRFYHEDEVQAYPIKNHRRQNAKVPVNKGINLISIEIDKSFNPEAFGMSADSRELGVNFSIEGYEDSDFSLWF